MKKLILILLCVISAICFAQPEQYGPYDPGAMRTGQVAKAADGTAAAPAYTFSSDPDTGIYSPGANTLGFGVNGAENARISPAGNVLIATSTDDGANKLQVNGFTKLGEAAAGIKMKVLTWTTNANPNGVSSVAHGIASSTKILDWGVSVEFDGAGGYMPPGFDQLAGGYVYGAYITPTSIAIVNGTESAEIVNKPARAIIWYKE